MFGRWPEPGESGFSCLLKNSPFQKKWWGKEGNSLGGVQSSMNVYREYRLCGSSLHI
jgi:hypothetical protein